jgi:hypothetical protein
MDEIFERHAARPKREVDWSRYNGSNFLDLLFEADAAQRRVRMETKKGLDPSEDGSRPVCPGTQAGQTR